MDDTSRRMTFKELNCAPEWSQICATCSLCKMGMINLSAGLLVSCVCERVAEPTMPDGTCDHWTRE